MTRHDLSKISMMILSLLTYTTMVVMHEGLEAGGFKGIFNIATANISHGYNTDLTPARWTFEVWNIIYIWQFIWLGYALSRLFRRNELGWVYMKPDILPNNFYFVWMLSNVLNVEWLFLRNAMHLISSLLILILLTVCNYIALIISHRALHPHVAWLKKHSNVDLWLIRILVQNGIAFYATWTTIETLLNFNIVLVYVGNMCSSTAAVISLCLFFFGLMWWFYLENVLLDKYVRNNVTVYPAAMLALTGILRKKPISFSPNSTSVLILVILVVTCGLASIRLVLVNCRDDEETPDESSPLEMLPVS